MKNCEYEFSDEFNNTVDRLSETCQIDNGAILAEAVGLLDLVVEEIKIGGRLVILDQDNVNWSEITLNIGPIGPICPAKIADNKTKKQTKKSQK